MERMSNSIEGLPTTLNDMVSLTQKFVNITGNLDKSVDTAEALNNAMLASGSSSADAARGIEQYAQMLGNGEPDMQSFKSINETMGYGLKRVAEEMVGTGSNAMDLYAKLKSGEITMDEMNDVNDFMEKFGDDFELKWGLAIDPELGSRVKVTVLATGFGLEDVEGMNRHMKKHTEEEARRIAEEEETRAERQNRRERYYGSDGNSTQYKRHPLIFLFRPEDLDNEDVILQVENTPTFKRTRQTLEDIRNLASGNAETEEAKKKDDNDTVQGVISFA